MSTILGYNGGRFYSALNRPILVDCSFTVAVADSGGLGITGLKGNLVRNVFMHTSSTPGRGPNGYLNPNPASGFALVQLKNNYFKYLSHLADVRPPVTGSGVAINGSALTIGSAYQIVTVGAGTAGSATIAPVADSAGSLASTWFRLYDAYGNTFVIWFSVSGIGSAPVGVSGTLVQQTISSGATAAQVGTALAITIAGLPSGVSGVFSFTAAGTTTVTVTSTRAAPLSGPPADGTIATGFTFAIVNFKTNIQNWYGVGLPSGLVPTVGQTFVATATGDSTGGGSSGTVKLMTIGAIQAVETLGDPSLTLNPAPVGPSGKAGGFILMQFLAATSSSVTTQIPSAPTDGTVVNLAFYLEAASVLIAGE